MMEVDTFVLENGVEYIEVDKLIYDNNTYVLLSNIKNVKDSCIRKLVIEDNKKYLYKINSNNEFETVLNLFMEKNKTLF